MHTKEERKIANEGRKKACPYSYIRICIYIYTYYNVELRIDTFVIASSTKDERAKDRTEGRRRGGGHSLCSDRGWIVLHLCATLERQNTFSGCASTRVRRHAIEEGGGRV